MKYICFLFFILSFSPVSFSRKIPSFSMSELRELAEKGNPEVQSFLAMRILFDHSLDYKEGIELSEKAADQGFVRSMYGLGLAYYSHHKVPQDLNKAVEWFTKAAERGDRDAQLEIGYLYLYGEGVSQNYKEAIKWFEKSANQGHPVAQNMLGEIYLHGRGGAPKNRGKAIRLFAKAFKQGYREAQYNIGLYYWNNGNGGLFSFNSESKAAEWFERASDRGHLEAKLKLEEVKKAKAEKTTQTNQTTQKIRSLSPAEKNLLKDIEKKWEKDFPENQRSDQKKTKKTSVEKNLYSHEYFEKILSENNPEDQYSLGMKYWEKNDERFFPLFERSAQLGYRKSVYRLGDMTFYGYGFTKESQMLVHWFAKAAKQGYLDARAIIEKIKEEVPSKQRSCKQSFAS